MVSARQQLCRGNVISDELCVGVCVLGVFSVSVCLRARGSTVTAAQCEMWKSGCLHSHGCCCLGNQMLLMCLLTSKKDDVYRVD